MDCEASEQDILERILHDENAEPKGLTLSLLKAITNNFSDDLLIGGGGFADVYKGWLRNGVVAVKKLYRTHEIQEKQYNEEVGCLMTVKHKNVVRFLGYYADTQGKACNHEGKIVLADVRQRLLCFEYLPKGSLDNYITDASSGLQWRKRYQMIKGISEGLHHLHQKHIVHLDLKPANILLDGNMVPKIADFGLSKRFGEKQSRAITARLFGTIGYLAPEFSNGEITFKLDIYSLGVIITEILTGKRGYTPVENVLESWRNRLLDTDTASADVLLEQVRVCAEISKECMDPNPEKRPATRRIIEMLGEAESIGEFCFEAVQRTSAVTQVAQRSWDLFTETDSESFMPGTSAKEVGAYFTRHYYSLLRESPEVVYQFYSSPNGREGGMDLKTVNEKIMAMKVAVAEVESVDAQESHGGGVAVHVTGRLTSHRDGLCRVFSQSFFLAPQKGGYFVLNDMFRYVRNDPPAPILGPDEALVRRLRDMWNKSTKDAPLGYNELVTNFLKLALRGTGEDSNKRHNLSHMIHELNELGSDAAESTTDQISKCMEDKSGVEPHELHLVPFELNKQTSNSNELMINSSDDYLDLKLGDNE